MLRGQAQSSWELFPNFFFLRHAEQRTLILILSWGLHKLGTACFVCKPMQAHTYGGILTWWGPACNVWTLLHFDIENFSSAGDAKK